MTTAATDTFQAGVSNALSCLKQSSLVCEVKTGSCYAIIWSGHDTQIYTVQFSVVFVERWQKLYILYEDNGV